MATLSFQLKLLIGALRAKWAGRVPSSLRRQRPRLQGHLGLLSPGRDPVSRQRECGGVEGGLRLPAHTLRRQDHTVPWSERTAERAVKRWRQESLHLLSGRFHLSAADQGMIKNKIQFIYFLDDFIYPLLIKV